LFETIRQGTIARIQRLVVGLWSIAVLLLLAYQLWQHGQLLHEGEHVTGSLQLPIAPVAFVMSGCSLIAALAVVILMTRPPEAEHGDEQAAPS
jgi:hypothetical protein